MSIRWDRPCYKCLSHYCDLSCKEAPKQEQGEPVAWMDDIKKESHKRFKLPTSQAAFQAGALLAMQYINTTPQQRKPLTDEAIATVYWGATGQSLRPQDNVLAHKFARAIEAAHGIKE